MKTKGFVSLVGAGPGNPELLTRRAYELLLTAEVVAHDKLVPNSILELASTKAELICVGRRHGDSVPVDQMIHPLVIDRALQGKRVLRLKAGDPMVFGRGAEEAEALKKAGIPYEIVPGITSALGAASYAGIPLTDRRCASHVEFSTGHYSSAAKASTTSDGTLVMYMVAKSIVANVQRLLAQGYSPGTPVACIASASRPNQLVETGKLADLPELVKRLPKSAPLLVIVGEVVELRDKTNWFSSRPLCGKRILMARSRPDISRLASQLRQAGAEVVEAPRFNVSQEGNHTNINKTLLEGKGSFSHLAFGDATGVDTVLSFWRDSGQDIRNFPKLPVICFDSSAEQAVLKWCINPSLVCHGATQKALAGCVYEFTGTKILLFGSDRGRPNLVKSLIELGAQVTEQSTYKLDYEKPNLDFNTFDLAIFPSSSTVDAITRDLDTADKSAFRELPAVVFGEITDAALRKQGVQSIHQAHKFEVVEAALCVVRKWSRAGTKEVV